MNANKIKWSYLIFWLVLLLIGLWYVFTSSEKPWYFEDKIAKRLVDNQAIPTRWHMQIGLWWGALINSVICIGMILMGWLIPHSIFENTKTIATIKVKSRPLTNLFIIFSVIWAVSYSIIYNHQCLGQSLWGDETYMVKKTVIGEFRPDKNNGELEYKPRPWRDTLFHYKSPNNHMGYSILARLIHGPVSQNGDKEKKFYFSEYKLRLPSFIAGLGTIVLISFYLWRIGLSLGAILAPWILALHPWFIRYSTEARGYSLLLFLTVLIFYFYYQYRKSNHLFTWIIFGFLQFIIFYSQPSSIYLLITLNIVFLFELLFQWKTNQNSKQILLKWFSASVFSALLAIQFCAPLYPQLKEFMASYKIEGGLGIDWLRDLYSYAYTGIPWHQWDASNPLCLSWSNTGVHTNTLIIWLILLGVLSLLGSYYILRSKLSTKHIALLLTAPASLMFLHSKLTDGFLYHWYFITLLLTVTILIPAGIVILSKKLAPQHSQIASYFFGGLFIFVFYLSGKSQRQIWRAHSLEPIKEAVLSYRQITNPFHKDINDVLSASFHMEGRAYDPMSIRVKNSTDLSDVIKKAHTENKPLFVHFGQRGLAEISYPSIFELLNDPTLFSPYKKLYGLSDQCTREIYKLTGSTTK